MKCRDREPGTQFATLVQFADDAFKACLYRCTCDGPGGPIVAEKIEGGRLEHMEFETWTQAAEWVGWDRIVGQERSRQLWCHKYEMAVARAEKAEREVLRLSEALEAGGHITREELQLRSERDAALLEAGQRAIERDELEGRLSREVIARRQVEAQRDEALARAEAAEAALEAERADPRPRRDWTEQEIKDASK